jgi:hypothetical protein
MGKTHRKNTRKNKRTKKKRVKRNKRKTFKLKQRGGGGPSKKEKAARAEAERAEAERAEAERASAEAAKAKEAYYAEMAANRARKITNRERREESDANAQSARIASENAAAAAEKRKIEERMGEEKKQIAQQDSKMIEETLVKYGKEIKFSELRDSMNAKFEFTTFKNIVGSSFLSSDVSNTTKYKIIKFDYSVTDDEFGEIHSRALLKCTNNNASNEKFFSTLLYEYFVGLLMNELYVKYPCFLETYNFFIRKTGKSNGQLEYLNSDQISNYFRIGTNKNVSSSDFEGANIDKILFKIYDIGQPDKKGNQLNEVCDQAENGILIQYLPTFTNFVDAGSGFNEMIWLLYQLYKPLAELNGVFAHNNLTLEQVILYTPYMDKYIQYNYVSKNGSFSFKSKYMLKIKNYSSCFFYKSETVNSDKIFDYINSKCSQKWLKKPEKTNSDINFLKTLNDKMQTIISEQNLTEIFADLLTSTDVLTIVTKLEALISSEDYKSKNDALYAGSTKFCDLNIPMDASMTIILK